MKVKGERWVIKKKSRRRERQRKDKGKLDSSGKEKDYGMVKKFQVRMDSSIKGKVSRRLKELSTCRLVNKRKCKR